jgi:hypothetical protein
LIFCGVSANLAIPANTKWPSRKRTWYGDSKRSYVLECEFYKRAAECERLIVAFMLRTGLPVSEITMVNWRGKMRPQWIGAVEPMTRSSRYIEDLLLGSWRHLP